MADGGLEAGDPEQDDLQTECREKAARLVESFGQTNEYADLLTVAERYRRIIARPPEEIGPRVLWSVGNTLRVALQAHEAAETAGRLAEVLPPKVVGALSDLMQTHGLFQLGHPGMQEVLDAIREAARGAEASPVREATLDAGEALAADDAQAEEELREVVGTLVAAARAGGSAAGMALGALRDTVFNAVRAFGLAAYKVSTEGLKAVFSYDVIQWLLGQQTLFERYWVAIAGEVPGWFVALMVRLVHIAASLS